MWGTRQQVDSTCILQAVCTTLFDDQNFSTVVSSEAFNGGEAYGAVRVTTITVVWK
jgi:hypothetical protein